ncbi:MAG: TldD/PmbA family protein [Pseudanabaenaceae cyanobacterium]
MEPCPQVWLPYLEAAQRLGAEAVEVFGWTSVTTTVEFAGNRLHQISQARRQGCTVRGWWGGRVGLATAGGRVDPQGLAARARDGAALGPRQDPCLASVSPQPARTTQGQIPTREALVAGGEAAIAYCREAVGDVVCSGTWEAVASRWELVNSEGLVCGQGRQWVDASLVAERVQGDDWLVVSEGLTAEATLDPVALAQPVIQRLQWSQTLSPMPTGILPVLLSPNAVAWWLTPVLAALDAEGVQLGVSPWGDRRGMAVGAPSLTLYQQPSARHGLPFDEEGTPTQPFAWIEGGVLQGFYGDRRHVQAIGESPRGNGFRNGGVPAPELFHVLIAPGTHTAQTLSTGAALWVEAVLGEDPEPGGDFAVSLELAFRLEDGAIVGRVKDGILAGNVLELLPHVTLGSDCQWVGSLYTPPWRVESLSLSR